VVVGSVVVSADVTRRIVGALGMTDVADGVVGSVLGTGDAGGAESTRDGQSGNENGGDARTHSVFLSC
jgi:hypothetical protein